MSKVYLADPACERDTFCEGIGNITKIGDSFRLTFFATRDLGNGEPPQHLVVAHLVWPRDALKNVIAQLDGALKGLPFIDAAVGHDERPPMLS